MRLLFTLLLLVPLIGFTQYWQQIGQDIDGEAANDWSGTFLSINASGSLIAIGAPHNDGNGTSAGHVRIYEWNGSSWFQKGQDIDGEASYNDSGTSLSLNYLGNRLAIGAPNNNGNGNNSGHVRVYEWSGSSWIQLGQDIDGDYYTGSGQSVDLNFIGDIVTIGSPRASFL